MTPGPEEATTEEGRSEETRVGGEKKGGKEVKKWRKLPCSTMKFMKM